MTELNFMPQEGSKLNLGKKISIPRDVMLEELSLLTNKGSKMFKLRQLRVEKFIYENNPDVFIDSSVDHFQKFIPSVGGHYGVDTHGYSISGGRMVGGVTSGQYGSHKMPYPPAPPPKPGSKGSAGGTGSGTGAGHGEGSAGDDKAGSGKHITIFKTYISPWEKAMGVTPQEKSEFIIDLLSYGSKANLPMYKSFNRSAMPYGGYEKAAKLMTFQMPKFEVAPPVPETVIVYNQDINNRPSFNRTPVPWLGSGEPNEYNIEINMPINGETEEL
uniref:Myozenin 1 n=1 Tax=Sphenodon punctatus TaxID=8508 RepID=A0A8D0LBA9_SPHPU